MMFRKLVCFFGPGPRVIASKLGIRGMERSHWKIDRQGRMSTKTSCIVAGESFGAS